MNKKTSSPTSDPNHIRLWAASQKAMPAELLPGIVDAEPTQLHFFIPGDTTHQPRLRIIEWDHFLAAFQAYGLSFVYEILPDGRPGKRFEILQVEDSSPGALPRTPPVHDSDTAQEYSK